MASNYIWPLSKSTTPDEMNTSFGPRINRNKWDFHDGIDLPAPIGTKVHAMRRGKVHRAGPGNPGPGGFSSRHVVLEVQDPSDGPMFLVYVHLHSIAEGITVGAAVAQGQFLGTVGEDRGRRCLKWGVRLGHPGDVRCMTVLPPSAIVLCVNRARGGHVLNRI